MQRMELYTSGVKMPKFGSNLDIMARRYLFKKANKDLTFASLVAHIASSAGNSREWTDNISRIWNEYVNLSSYSESFIKQQNEETFKAWEYWKTVKPKIVKVTGNSSKPNLHVSLNLEESNKKPKKEKNSSTLK
jgi:hypothetical protein